MVYKIIVSPRAQKEIENAIDYYLINSIDLPLNFISSIKSTYKTLETNPFFLVVYKNIRSLKIKTFPYTIYFTIDEEKSIVRILSYFHNKRNPKNRPRI